MRFAVLVLLTACGPSDEQPPGLVTVPSTASSLEVEVGTGNVDFEPIADGAGVPIIHGAQGGYHVWTAVRVKQVDVADARINLYARFEDSHAPAGDPSGLAVSLYLEGGARVAWGMRDFIHDPTAAEGKRIVLRAEVVANDGRHGEAERVVVPHVP